MEVRTTMEVVPSTSLLQHESTIGSTRLPRKQLGLDVHRPASTLVDFRGSSVFYRSRIYTLFLVFNESVHGSLVCMFPWELEQLLWSYTHASNRVGVCGSTWMAVGRLQGYTENPDFPPTTIFRRTSMLCSSGMRRGCAKRHTGAMRRVLFARSTERLVLWADVLTDRDQ